MPTLRPRHVVTETEQVAQALDAAARRWPAEDGNRAKLLQRLIQQGHHALLDEQEQLVRERRDAVTSTSGVLTGCYGEDYLASLREDWPA